MTTRTKPTAYSVTAETRNGGEACVRSRTSTIVFDGTVKSGDVLPGPADLLCASLSACILKNVERFSHLLPFRYESATVHVTAEREEPPPRIIRMSYRLRVVTDEAATRVTLLHDNIRKFGTISNTLAAACEVVGDIEAVAPAAATATTEPA